MQFSTLTLHTLRAIDELTKGKVNLFVSWAEARDDIQKAGFSWKQADGELERFCYGFECIDSYDEAGNHQIALTSLGRGFIDQLLAELNYQRSQVACIMRPARKKECWNVIVQETTFFHPHIYELLKQYGFRPGPARDFLKCISTATLTGFIDSVVDLLSVPTSMRPSSTLADCIREVEKHGKYWASVGGKYSWFVFGQEFTLPLDQNDWRLYQTLVKALIRPPEWGGGREITFSALRDLLTNEETLLKFRELGIVRPRWVDSSFRNAQFRLTAPGYLIWERKSKGFCYEFQFRRQSEEGFSIGLCNATDFPGKPIDPSEVNGIPSAVWRGTKADIMTRFLTTITKESNLLFI